MLKLLNNEVHHKDWFECPNCKNAVYLTTACSVCFACKATVFSDGTFKFLPSGSTTVFQQSYADVKTLRILAAIANSQPDGHLQPPLPNWQVIGELIDERDQLFFVALAAKKADEIPNDKTREALSRALDALPESNKSKLEA